MNNPADTLAALAECIAAIQREETDAGKMIGYRAGQSLLKRFADALASLKGEAEPVGEIVARPYGYGIDWLVSPAPPVGSILYTTPPAPQAVGEVTEARVEAALAVLGLRADRKDDVRAALRVALSTPSPAPQGGGEAQSSEADELLRSLGLDPDRFRSEGGHLNPGRIKAAILRPEDYSGLYLASDHLFSHSANLGGEVCERCGAVKKTRRGNAPCLATPPAQQPGEVEPLRTALAECLDAMNNHVAMYPHMDKGFMVDARKAAAAALRAEQAVGDEQRARELVGGLMPVTHGMRRKGTDAIIGVVPNKIAAKPATREEYLAEYEEVPLYTFDQVLELGRALGTARQSEGVVLVPKIPTKRMVSSALYALEEVASANAIVEEVYAAMLAAAPGGEGEGK